jgi:ribonuclease HII
MILAGIDEAGYGPMLGPLVVSITLFRLEGDAPAPDLWECLRSVVRRSPDGYTMPVNDSKKLFQQGKGLRHLEEGLLPFVRLRHGAVPRDLRALLEIIARRGAEPAGAYLEQYPWYRGKNLPLPRDTFVNFLDRLAARLDDCLRKSRMEFLGLAAVPLEVVEFNQSLDAGGNKAEVSFQALSSFLRRLWHQHPGEAVEILVDRQGGRHNYAPLLFEKLQPRGIHIDEQTPERSVYRLARRGRDAASFRITFATECEDKCLAVALASMLSKYIRELHMALFNEYWKEHLAGLKPTAGYFKDARRFLAETTVVREQLGIGDALLIRRR